MSEEILMNVTPREVRVAIVENGVLQELMIERANRRGLVGNIYKGKISRVLPGMQAAFVELGLQRTAFLHVSDLVETQPHQPAPGEPRTASARVPDIASLLHDGQTLLVQVVKDPLGSKGARLTTVVSLPSRYLVFIPQSQGVGISQKIEDPAERERLKAIALSMAQQTGGAYIVRTAADGIDEDTLRADAAFFAQLWHDIQEAGRTAQPSQVVYEDLPLILRTMRDRARADVGRVLIDSRETFKRVTDFAQKFMPPVLDKLEYYPGERPLFELYSVEDEIQRALNRKVQLKSGGYLIIDQTEALTTIDINTGAFVGHRNLDETIFKTNLEAAQAIARQLRLRNLGGIIIVDFIDMTDEDHKRQVLRAFEKSLQKDSAKTKISGVSALGLVEMTRKRTQESLAHILCDTCPECAGRGQVKSTETLCYDIFREIIRTYRQFEAAGFLVLVSSAVANRLEDEEANAVAELEAFIGRAVKFQVETLYTREQFDVVLM